jgi:hypothetical protein
MADVLMLIEFVYRGGLAKFTARHASTASGRKFLCRQFTKFMGYPPKKGFNNAST